MRHTQRAKATAAAAALPVPSASANLSFAQSLPATAAVLGQTREIEFT